MNFTTTSEEPGVKRFFRARQKLIEPGFVSHITQRAASTEVLFIEDEDYLSFLALLKKVVSRFSIKCLKGKRFKIDINGMAVIKKICYI